MAEKLSFKGALLKLRKAPNDATAQARVTDEIQDRALLTLDGEGQIDVAETEEGVAFANRPGRRLNGMEGRVSLSDWLSRQAPRDEACPISGRLLYKGVTTQGRPKVDWSVVTMPRRFAVAMARLNHEQAAQPGQEEIAAAAMKQEAPPVPYSRFLEEWAELAKAVEGGRPSAAQRNLHQASKDACYHEEAPAAAGSSFPVETVSAQPAPQPGAPQGEASVAAPGAVRIVVVSSPKDRDFVEDLRTNLAGPLRAGRITLFDQNIDIRPGANVSAALADEVRRADIFLYICTSDMLASRGSDAQTWVTTFANARHIPVLVKACMLEYSALAGKVSLPPGGKPSREAFDSVAGLMQVVAAILAARR